MSALSLRLPHSLHERVRDLARREGISINQFVATALAEKLSALLTQEYLEARGKRGRRSRYLDALGKVPAGEPELEDRPSASAAMVREEVKRPAVGRRRRRG